VQLHAVAPSGLPSNCQLTEPHKQVPLIIIKIPYRKLHGFWRIVVC